MLNSGLNLDYDKANLTQYRREDLIFPRPPLERPTSLASNYGHSSISVGVEAAWQLALVAAVESRQLQTRPRSLIVVPSASGPHGVPPWLPVEPVLLNRRKDAPLSAERHARERKRLRRLFDGISSSLADAVLRAPPRAIWSQSSTLSTSTVLARSRSGRVKSPAE